MIAEAYIAEEWRDLWSYKAEFLLAAFAYVISTSNFLNLPYFIAHNGGCTFIASLIMNSTVNASLFFL